MAREAYAHAINYYQDSNRFNQAAKLHVEIAQTWLDEGNSLFFSIDYTV